MKIMIRLCLTVLLLSAMLSGCLQVDKPNLNTQPSATAATTTIPTTMPTQPQTTTTAPTQLPTISTQPTTVPTEPVDPGIEIEVLTVAYDCSSEVPKPTGITRWPIVLKSMKDIQELTNGDVPALFTRVADYLMERYDDAFFQQNTLICTFFYARIHDSVFKAERCLKTEDGYYYITIGTSGPTIGNTTWWGGEVFHVMEVRADIPKNAIIYIELPEQYARLILE